MHALTEKQIRSSFVNASRREVDRAVLPDLATQPWEHLDLLGWRDPKAPLAAYVVLELDRGPVGLLLRAPEPGGRRKKAMCAWCRDLLAVLLNANARKVDARVVKALSHAVPEQDLFLSRSELDARRIVQSVLERGYPLVFTGGGDGTCDCCAPQPTAIPEGARDHG